MSPSEEPEIPDLITEECTCRRWTIGDGVEVADLIPRASRAAASSQGKLGKAVGQGTHPIAVDHT